MAQPYGKVWVIGLGTTGSALAARLACGGVRVMGIEADTAALARGREAVERQVRQLAQSPVDAVLGLVDYGTKPDLAWTPDLVVEALPDDLDLKCSVLSRTGALCPEETVFVTTTMGLSVTEIAARSGRMSRTVGLVPSSLPDGVVEVVRTPVTDRSVVDEVRDLVSALGQVPVWSHDHPGFIGNSLLLGYLNDAAAMCASGYASRDDIDTAMTLGCGLPVGPLSLLDAIGVDAVVDSLAALAARGAGQWAEPAPVLTRMAADGQLGRKTGRGFHTYDNDDDHAPVNTDMGVSPRPVSRIGVVGSGVMATGIAEICARAGYTTTITSRSGARAKEAVAGVERSLARALRKGKVTTDDVGAALANLTPTDDLDQLAACDLVVEAVAEDLDRKQSVFRTLSDVTRPGAVLATTTSSLSVAHCATATTRPGDVLGMHFFNPAPVMKLVEVSDTPMTAPDALATALSVARSLGKTPVRCGDRTGFVVNALLFPYLNRAVRMLRERHVSVSDVDTVLAGGHGFPLGPFQLLDVIGLDVSAAILDRLAEGFSDPTLTPARELTDLASAGYLGRKSGRGFYTYPTPA